jgi:hypothetical protein
LKAKTLVVKTLVVKTLVVKTLVCKQVAQGTNFEGYEYMKM